MNYKKIIHIILILLSISLLQTCDSGKKQVRKYKKGIARKVKKYTPLYMEITSYYYADSHDNIVDPENKRIAQNTSFAFSVPQADITAGMFYGQLNLVGPFAERYNNSTTYGAVLGLKKILYYFRPELAFQYAKVSSKQRQDVVHSSMELMQYMIGIKGEFNIIRLFDRYVSVTAGAMYGLTSLTFDSDNIDSKTISYYHTATISGGIIYPIFTWFALGVEANYQVVYAGGDNITATVLLVKGEIRL